MGAFYVLGIVNKFEAISTNQLNQVNWEQYLNERLDLEQYTTTLTDYTVKGNLKEEVFKENIEDFFKILVEITREDRITTYFGDSKTDIDSYHSRYTVMTFEYQDTQITISAEIAILFIEGKVSVEEFSFEPKIINWLFRHIDISNPLTGCVMGDVLG
ncbi:hypothetical protein [Virgibacillus sp. SK37]|uniref:hypothetical protein n=1 Tax=Virgibacillus sp. SK37 TaxID=403957 RepID=UPI0011A8EFFF|nr:hypothetical protein [Virgibacillus sp. SK37]